MAKPTYRLEALLRVKQQEKRRQAILLAKALRQLEEEKKKLKELEASLKILKQNRKNARDRMAVEMQAGGAIGEGCHHVNFLRKMKEEIEAKNEEIEDQKLEVEEAVERTAKARKQYIQAIKELRVMEKHKELWRKKVAKEISRREEKEMDELGQTIHSLRKWRGEEQVFEG